MNDSPPISSATTRLALGNGRVGSQRPKPWDGTKRRFVGGKPPFAEGTVNEMVVPGANLSVAHPGDGRFESRPVIVYSGTPDKPDLDVGQRAVAQPID